MPWLGNGTRFGSSFTTCGRHHVLKIKSFARPRRKLSSSSTRQLQEVPLLPSWDRLVFEQAYKQNLPARLARSEAHLPPACSKWFIYNNDPELDLSHIKHGHGTTDEIKVPSSPELRSSFWAEHGSTFVPLEVTTLREGQVESEEFERIEAPLKMLLAYLSKPSKLFEKSTSTTSIYLAQCDLSSLPASLQADVPVPNLLQPSPSAGIKGDVYASSLWLGRPPTYTPLHRDPNPNLFIQLAGQKTIRLLAPEVGDALYQDLMTRMSPQSSSFSSRIRGDEMMAGPQKEALHDAVWDQSSIYDELIQTQCLETTLGLGDTLFMPRGWWHSVKGVGEGVTASVNWWFR